MHRTIDFDAVDKILDIADQFRARAMPFVALVRHLIDDACDEGFDKRSLEIAYPCFIVRD